MIFLEGLQRAGEGELPPLFVYRYFRSDIITSAFMPMRPLPGLKAGGFVAAGLRESFPPPKKKIFQDCT